MGSNDIGLDRGQLGKNRVIKFIRSGPKLLLIQANYSFRAESDNEAERKSVEEAFAQSILWGFAIESEKNGKLIIDITPFMVRDAHGVVCALTRLGVNYSLPNVASAAPYRLGGCITSRNK